MSRLQFYGAPKREACVSNSELRVDVMVPLWRSASVDRPFRSSFPTSDFFPLSYVRLADWSESTRHGLRCLLILWRGAISEVCSVLHILSRVSLFTNIVSSPPSPPTLYPQHMGRQHDDSPHQNGGYFLVARSQSPRS